MVPRRREAAVDGTRAIAANSCGFIAIEATIATGMPSDAAFGLFNEFGGPTLVWFSSSAANKARKDCRQGA
jgi:hypothetical protein